MTPEERAQAKKTAAEAQAHWERAHPHEGPNLFLEYPSPFQRELLQQRRQEKLDNDNEKDNREAPAEGLLNDGPGDDPPR